MANTYTAISSQVLTGTAASITFSSIPNTYTDLVIRASTRDTNTLAAFNGSFTIRINSDSATNYSVTDLYGDGGSAGSSRQSNQTQAAFFRADLNAANSTANTFSVVEVYIPNYTLTTARPLLGVAGAEGNVANAYMNMTASLYRGTSSISSIVISPSTLFTAGSRFDLYGITHI